ncbi:type IV toxin-antitoxin system AbiEi family antitoxin domain-containing protein [Microbacterium sp. B19]|uniref:type IV toxin-antitoxin system AbiEi family antitoxin domain-containing protein n=1 Tax=Microbacterium sp. B19 TaxID=96765 RepID=UPI000344B8ED|nr:type IV toxin-antitoxin system AbiEi family antitoxin domain-containing protein [Microbacterium sp. B19]
MSGYTPLTRDDLAADGVGSSALERLLGTGEVVRLRPGVYLRPERDSAPKPEEWIIARAQALAMVSRERPLFSHLTAAALHGLPVHGPPSPKVHVIVEPRRPGAATGVVRHRGEVPLDQIVERHGLRCTSLDRTLADIARTTAFETAVCALDAGLRLVAAPALGTHLPHAEEEQRERIREISSRSAHGRARALRSIAFADGRAQLPGESISRIRLRELGFAPPDLQVAIPGPSGRDYYVDFGLSDVCAWGEFDGETKYRDDALRSGLTLDQVLLREKQREDWIRGRTQRPLARWQWSHLRTADALGRRLSAFGIRPL